MTERHSMTRRGTITIGSAGRAARTDAGRAAPGWPAVVLRVAGSGLLIATAAIHLDLYLTGYRTIPTIGWLFLLQVIAAFGLGLAVLAIPRRLAAGVPTRLAAAAGAGFALATLGGLPPVGLDRAVRVQGGPHGRRHRGRPGGGGRLRGAGRAGACSRPGGRRGGGPGPIPRPDPAGDRPGGRNDRRRPDGCGAGAVRGGGGRGQPGGTRGHGREPEDRDDRRDDGADRRQGLHALLVRPRHPGQLEMLR